ncbi:MAG: nucleotidyl transferase AbiEii/AbiGii toxin family protein [Sediminibacterium sp.]|nr:nucleotidyl transferase AbiEii/AbiGii toxin family protein [Sediminibacterium sp.]
MSQHTNIIRIKAISALLDQLKEDVVFVGGATVALYADTIAAEARPTDDVDVIIELLSYKGYAELDERLRAAGFVNDSESGVICRYQIQGITVDIMPTHPEVIGFSNKWYPAGFKEAISIDIDGRSIKIFSLPFFIASKLEAFKSRGRGNYRYSSDFEDIVYVLENNSQAKELFSNASPDVFSYLQNAFSEMLSDPDFEEGLTAHLEPNTSSQQFIKIEAMLKALFQ